MENVAKVKINGGSCMALLDNSVQVNTITPRYVKEHSLQVGPITNLMGSKVTCIGLGNAYTRPLGYVVIQVQVDGVQGYDKDQIALIIPDHSNFSTRIPIILGTLTIGRVVNVMREVEMDTLAVPWVNTRAAHLLAVRRMTPVEVGNDQEEGYNTDKDSLLMYTQKAETLEPFSSHVIPVKTTKAYLLEGLHVMVQALYAQDRTLLPGHTVQNMYTELRKDSKKAVVVVQNNTAYPQTLRRKLPVARAMSVLPVPEAPKPESLQVEDDANLDLHTPNLMIRQRRGKPIWWVRPKWFGYLGSRVGGWSTLTPCWVPRCVVIGSGRAGLNSLYQAYHKGNWRYPFQGTIQMDPTADGGGSQEPFAEKCWNLVSSGLVKALGAMLSCWWERRMAVCIFALISDAWMPIQRRIPTHCLEYKRH